MSSPPTGSLVLVTGASGYLGGWVIVSLLQQGYQVRGTLRSTNKEGAIRAALSKHVPSANDRSRLEFIQADLTVDDGSWDAAVSGCEYVLHVASDMGTAQSKLSDLIGVARDGTVRVMRAAIKERVKRIVVTSTCLTLFDSKLKNGTVTEASWGDSNDKKLTAYPKSKIIAERAAWEEIEQHGNGYTTLTVVCPSFIQGPMVGNTLSPSIQLVSRMLSGQVPALPRIQLHVVDVRDVAVLHVLAMTAANAANQRFIGTSEKMWMREIAECLKSNLSAEEGRLVAVRTLPDWILRFAALFSAEAAVIAGILNRDIKYDSGKARAELGWKSRPARQTLNDTARALIKEGLV